MPRSPEQLALTWVPGAGPVQLHELDAGLVNRSYRVRRAGRQYSLRLASPQLEEPRAARRWECRVLQTVAAAGLGPTVHRCDPARGILVAEWVEGRHWDSAETRLPGNRDALAALLRRVHALPVPAAPLAMGPVAWIDRYSAALTHGGGEVAAPLAEWNDAARAQVAAWERYARAATVLCHSDLHRFNVLVGERLTLLDWEFAHVSDGWWDVVGWAANNDWSPEDTELLLASYLERPCEPEERARLSVLTWLYDYVCLLWGELHLRRRPGAQSGEVARRMTVIAARLAA